MEFGPMNVQVQILVLGEPTAQNRASMKSAATRLTDDRKSIKVSVQTTDHTSVLVADFMMKRAAQYKVVGEISHQFKLSTWDFGGDQEMIISFPLTASEREYRARKQEKQKQRRRKN